MSGRVLIVDDEPNLRAMMRLTLEAAGYAVGEAADAAAGLEAFGDGSQWVVVLLDQRLPDAEGVEVLRRIKERAPAARVVMVTAFATIELAVDAIKAGATDFVRKPMTPEILRGAVAAALAGPTAPAAADERRPRVFVEKVTMNGYRIWREEDARGAAREDGSGARRFIVIDSRGRRQEVVVEIAPEAVAAVERTIDRRLPVGSFFWTDRAERFLSAFLWNDGRPPADGKLTLRGPGPDETAAAARWPAEGEGKD